LLRGLPYEQIERCAENNRLDPQLVLDIILQHNGWSKQLGYVKYDLAKVTVLLDTATFARAKVALEKSE